MKNQYFGDVNDYRKYGLLRALQSSGELRLCVGWMLTPNDGSTDGADRRYAKEPGHWRHYDPALFDHLSPACARDAAPSVMMIEQAGILPRATFFSELVQDERVARRVWGERLTQAAHGSDLVFLDPDNGFEVASKPIGRKDSSKYAAWCEIEQLWEAGSSLLVYQHFCRESHDAFVSRIAGELRRHTDARFIEAFRTSNVVFLLAAQQEHQEVFEEAMARRLPGWEGQITVVGLWSGR